MSGNVAGSSCCCGVKECPTGYCGAPLSLSLALSLYFSLSLSLSSCNSSTYPRNSNANTAACLHVDGRRHGVRPGAGGGSFFAWRVALLLRLGRFSPSHAWSVPASWDNFEAQDCLKHRVCGVSERVLPTGLCLLARNPVFECSLGAS